MTNEPKVVVHAEKPCVAIPVSVTMNDFGKAIAAVPWVFEWLAEKDIPPAGPVFFRYLSDPDDEPDMNTWSTEIAYLLRDGSSN